MNIDAQKAQEGYMMMNYMGKSVGTPARSLFLLKSRILKRVYPAFVGVTLSNVQGRLYFFRFRISDVLIRVGIAGHLTILYSHDTILS